MQSLVADLLTYSRLGRKNIPHVAVDVEAACRTAIENLQFAIEESGAVVNCRRLPRVTADESQLVQLFQNLIGNALKYHGEEPPQIEIGVRNVSWPLEDHPEQHAPSASQQPENRRELRGKGRRITFYVRDNGIGIQPQYFDRIFVIFQRLHHKDEYSGTGIGLSICKKIVMQHGGQIRVESTPGKGSTFYFTLPKAKHDGTLRNAVATSASDGELSSASRPGFVNNLQSVRSSET
jgi:light-regulated signal transduction histidine kinase (bacteriophytochrome)